MASKLPTAHEPESLFTAFKVILPRSKGYWVRRNIIRQRFVDAGAKSVEDFAQARQYYEPAEIENLCARSLPALLDIAVGVIELHTRTCLDSVVEESDALELDVLNRLSLPLLLPEPIPRYRLAVLHGRYNFKMTEMLYRAASEMDIEIFVLAEPDHWFQSNEYVKFRKAYIPVDIQRVDDTLPQRIVDALHDHHIEVNGVVALTDKWLIPAAQAAQILGLPTESTRVYEICRDKFLTRQLDLPPDFMSERVEGLKGAKVWLEKKRKNGETLEYPLIVKPCAGWASEGVRKVHSEAELLDAVGKANLNDYSRGDLVTIETYIDGPEFDANFVLWEGKPLFSEISDQFPAEADIDTSSSTNFLETELFLPSALPSNEQDLIRQDMLNILGKIASQNGIHHMEGRMRNSAMEYRVTDGTTDLAWKSDALIGEPKSVLIENNPRPPGTNSNTVILHTYGVEFYALHLLIALGDAPRIRALSVPFRNGSQYHCDLVSIPVVRGGIFASRGATADLFQRLPHLQSLVKKSGCYFSYGEEVPDPSSGIWTQIAYFMVASRTSRKEVIYAAQEIRENFRYKLVTSLNELDA
jgi:biotin carboxylase